MKDFKTLLAIRRKVKAKKPTFAQQDTHKKVKLKITWRKPRGTDSKLRLNLSGKVRKPSKGYMSPALVKGMSRNGLKQVLVHTAAEVIGLDAKKDGILIAASVGTKKRVEIAKKAIEAGIIILNLKNPQEYIKSVEDKIAQKKTQKQEKEKQKETKKKEKQKKADEKEKKKDEKGKDQLSEKVEEAEKKKEEKKEMDRNLIHTS